MSTFKDPRYKNAKCEGLNKFGEPLKILKLSDGDGLFLFVTPDGKKRWRYRYFTKAGKEGLVSLGAYPAVSLTEARAAAAELRKQDDPGQQRRDLKQAEQVATSNDFESVARAWHAKQTHWTKKNVSDVLTRLERFVFPVIGARGISQISRRELADLMESITHKGSASLAHRTLPILSSIFRYAAAKELCNHNPCGDFTLRDLSIKKPAPIRQPAVNRDQLPELLRAIETCENRQTKLAVKLIFRLFVRANEMLHATWDEVDFDNALLRIPAERMKKRLPLSVPLSHQAIAILKELQGLNCGSPFVFPGRSYKKPLSSKALLEVFKNIGYGGTQTTHGIRRIASTVLNGASDSEGHLLFHADVIERSLAHVKEALRGTYDESEYLPQRKVMMQWWSDWLDMKAKEGI